MRTAVTLSILMATTTASAQILAQLDDEITRAKSNLQTATSTTGFSLSDLIGDGQSRFVLLGGMRLLAGKRDSVHILYIDQSPSRDRMEKTIDLSGDAFVPALTGYYERQGERFSLQTGFDGFISTYYSATFFFGASYHLVNNDGFKVKAGARLAYGFGRRKLGEVVNNSIYFDIGGQKLYDRELILTYKDNLTALQPNISVEKSLGGRLSFMAALTTTVAVRTKAVIEFKGSGNLLSGANSSDPAEVELTDVNLTMTQNGEKLDRLPLSYSGATLQIGFGYNF